MLDGRRQLSAFPPRPALPKETHPQSKAMAAHTHWWIKVEDKGWPFQASWVHSEESLWLSILCGCHGSYIILVISYCLALLSRRNNTVFVIVEHVKFQGSQCGKFTYIYTNLPTVFQTHTSRSHHCKRLVNLGLQILRLTPNTQTSGPVHGWEREKVKEIEVKWGHMYMARKQLLKDIYQNTNVPLWSMSL